MQHNQNEEMSAILSPIKAALKEIETFQQLEPFPKRQKRLSKGTFDSLKGKHLQAMKNWKSEFESGNNQNRLAHCMLYSILESTGDLDEVSELFDFVESSTGNGNEESLLVLLEHSLIEIFRQFFVRGFAIIPPSYDGTSMQKYSNRFDGRTLIKFSNKFEDRNFVKFLSLHPKENHFLAKPKTFVKMLLFRNQV